jgi:hypothetical protein
MTKIRIESSVSYAVEARRGIMRRVDRGQQLRVLGLCLLGVPLLRLGFPLGQRGAHSAAPGQGLAWVGTPVPQRRTGCDAVLWEARGWRRLAIQEVNRERERLDAWDPEAMAEIDQEAWRLQRMALDPSGHLRRSVVVARRAAALARTPAEQYRAAEHISRIAHEVGDHREELRQARRLMKLAPQNRISQLLLRRALRCGVRKPLA